MRADPAHRVRWGKRASRGGKAIWINSRRENDDPGVKLAGEMSQSSVSGKDELAGLDQTGSLSWGFEKLAKGAISGAAVRDPGGVIEVKEERTA